MYLLITQTLLWIIMSLYSVYLLMTQTLLWTILSLYSVYFVDGTNFIVDYQDCVFDFDSTLMWNIIILAMDGRCWIFAHYRELFFLFS